MPSLFKATERIPFSLAKPTQLVLKAAWGVDTFSLISIRLLNFLRIIFTILYAGPNTLMLFISSILHLVCYAIGIRSNNPTAQTVAAIVNFFTYIYTLHLSTYHPLLVLPQVIYSFYFTITTQLLKYWMVAVYSIAIVTFLELALVHQMILEAVSICFLLLSVGAIEKQVYVTFSEKCESLQKVTETLEKESDEKSMFISSVSHEFRSPLLSITGCLELFKQQRISKEQKGLITTIQSSVDILLAIIDDILNFAKMESHHGQQQASGKPRMQEIVNLRESIEKVASIANKYSNDVLVETVLTTTTQEVATEEATSTSLSSSSSTSFPTFVQIPNNIKLQQSLFNILTNAIKASKKEDKVLLRVSANTKESSLRFEIVDCGPGIPKEKQHLLFTPFFQSHQGSSKVPSTGLGLAICKKFINAMDGDVTFFSDSNGTTFTITLPYNAVHQEQQLVATSTIHLDNDSKFLKLHIEASDHHHDTPETKDDQADSHALTSPTAASVASTTLPCSGIIIAEDNSLNRNIIKRILSTEFGHIEAVENGAELIKAFDTQKYKVVITDYHMPVLDGLEASKEIRKKFGDTVKIVLLTADQDMCNESLDSQPVDAIVAKPITNWKGLKELLRKLREETRIG